MKKFNISVPITQTKNIKENFIFSSEEARTTLILVIGQSWTFSKSIKTRIDWSKFKNEKNIRGEIDWIIKNCKNVTDVENVSKSRLIVDWKINAKHKAKRLLKYLWSIEC